MGSLDFIKPILHFLPEVSTPDRPASFGQKMMWTGVALLLFFVMYNVIAVGVDPRLASQSDFLQVVTASRLGSLISSGIGPIVLASIFLQLFAGAKIIDVNMQNPDEKATFQGTQKLLAIILCFLEAAMLVYVGHLSVVPLFPGESIAANATGTGFIVNAPLTQFLVLFQIALGSMILLYLDEVVSKHGIGSGISMFIAAGVSLAIIGGTISLFIGESGVFAALSSGGAEVIAKAALALLPLVVTVIVFLVIVYMEGIKVEIPLAFERARGIGTGFPIKLMYVSNIPVILASALLLNMSLVGGFLVDQHWCITGSYDPAIQAYNKCGDGINLAQVIGFATSDRRLHDGMLYFVSPIYHSGGDYGTYFNQLLTGTTPVFGIPEWVHVVTYIIFMMVICVIFGHFWVETTGMDAASVAKQLDGAGLQIPGYRRDPRVVQTMLEKYIPPIVVIGSAFVGLLAALADMTGALGTGTGILLTVGILYRMYQDIERQNVFELNSLASKLLGK